MTTPTPTLPAAIAEVRREIALRQRVYPRWIERRKLTQQKADWQIACMKLALANLEDLAQMLPPQPQP